LILDLLEKIDADILRKAIEVSFEEFIRRAITHLGRGPYKGVHTVFSGFNAVFRRYYNQDPIQAIKSLESDGKIVSRPTKDDVPVSC
jgi:hypothetical protein